MPSPKEKAKTLAQRITELEEWKAKLPSPYFNDMLKNSDDWATRRLRDITYQEPVPPIVRWPRFVIRMDVL